MKFIFLFNCLLSTIVYGQSDLKRGLIAYFPCNGNLKDESGLDNDAILNRVTFVSDRNGLEKSAAYFNGVNAFAELPYNNLYNFSSKSNFSISVWVSPDPGNNWPAQAVIVKSPPHYDFTQSVWDYGVYILNYQGMAGYGYNHVLNSKSVINSKTCWYNIIVIYSAGTWKMFINGREESSSGVQKKYITRDPASILVLGKKGASRGDFYKGKMDEVRIYNRILTHDEISLLSANPCIKTDCTDKATALFNYSISQCNQVSFKLKTNNLSAFLKVRWSFGDGNYSAKTTPVHIYNQGKYNVQAITTSKNGCTDTFSRTINFQPLTAGYTITEAGNPGELVFKATANGPGYSWDFGDGTTLENETMVRHRFLESREYSTRLIAVNNTGCRDTVIKKITIKLPVLQEKDRPAILQPILPEETHTLLPEQRTKDIIQTILTEQDSVSIALYDNGIIDGDSISLIYDGKIVLTNQLLQRHPITLKLPVGKDREVHELAMYAINLGSIPPNTALMIVYDGNTRHEIYISSSADSNGVVLFSRRR